MHTITGHDLYSSSGERIGEITDLVGAADPAPGAAPGDGVAPAWLTVKTGWFAQRLVPSTIVVEGDGRYVTDCTKDEIKQAPKVPVHFEPSGQDLEDLCAYYRMPTTDVDGHHLRPTA